MNCITQAQKYLANGFSIIPLRIDGSKAPKIAWGEFQKRQPTPSEVEQWFDQESSGIGVLAGEVSKNLYVLDFDHDVEEQFPKFKEQLEIRVPEVLGKVLIVSTPRPGKQIWLRLNQSPPKNQVLAFSDPVAILDDSGNQRVDDSGAPITQPRILIETRGEGGYVVAAGSPPEVHPKNLPYEIESGSIESLGVLDDQEFEKVIEICKDFNKFNPQLEMQYSGQKYSGEPRPGDVFNQNADIRDLLIQCGWASNGIVDDETEYWVRPGKDLIGHSATLGRVRDGNDKPLLYVFSDAAIPFKQNHCYDAFTVFALTQHNGDFSKAATVARAMYPNQLLEAQVAFHAVSKGAEQLSKPALEYKTFPLYCLPDVVRDYVQEHAEAIGVDPAFVAVPMLPVLAACIGRSRKVEIKASWDEPSIIWAITIGPVSSGKTPGWEAATKPLIHIENKLRLVRKQSEEVFQAQSNSYEQAKAQGEKGLMKPNRIEHKEQFLLNNVTMEALADVAESNQKLLLSIDEIASWIKMMNQYRKGRDVEDWLELYNGRGINITRKTDNYRVWVPETCISVTGTTQPQVAEKEIFNEVLMQNGFAARVLAARPPSSIVRWSDKEVGPSTNLAMFNLASKLYELQGLNGETGMEPMKLRFSEEAKQRFIRWVNESADYAEHLEDGLRSIWVKLRPVAARFALVLSVTQQVVASPDDKATQPIDLHSTEAGIEIARWFGHELERNAAAFFQSELRKHLEWIINKYPLGVDARTLVSGRRSIKNADEARLVIKQLAEQGFGYVSGTSFVPYS